MARTPQGTLIPAPRPNGGEEGATELPVYKIKRTLEFEHLVIYFHIYLSYKWISLKELRITKLATKCFHVLSHTFL